MQNIFIDILPPWVETGLQPAFYDLESGTVLQQTARMYAKVRELNDAFNQFSEDVSTEINNFERETNTEIERFEQATNDEIERFEGVVNDTVEEYIKKFNELHDYVEDYFENLDVQEEINNKLDEMAEDGTLQEIITTYIQANVEWTFDSVAEMQTATNLIAGSYAETIGYYSANDGGGALYLITDVQPSGIYETLPNDLYAELIINGKLNVKQLGAYGDGTHDDSTVLQRAFDLANTYTIYMPKGDYAITTGLNLNGIDLVIDGDDANIIYSGSGYAINSHYLRFCTIRLGNVSAANGGCIDFEVASSSDQFVYDNIYFRSFSASTSCVKAHCTGGGWINEIRWFNGKLLAGQYGFNIEHDHTGQWANNAINSWHFNNVGIEGVTTGFYLNSISGRITQINFNGLRNAESFTTLLKTSGTVDRCTFTGSNMIIDTWLDLSANTNNIDLFCPVQIANVIYPFGYINGGKITSSKNMYSLLETSIPLAGTDDLNAILKPGTYSSDNNYITQAISNKPSEITSGAFKMTVMEMSGQIVTSSTLYASLQQIIYYDDRIFVRRININNGTPSVGSWAKLQKEIEPPIINGGVALAATDDLNNIVVPNTYTSNNNYITQGISNKPSAVTGGAFKMVVMELTNNVRKSGDTTYYLQQTIYTGGAMYIRSVSSYEGNKTVGAWKTITTS